MLLLSVHNLAYQCLTLGVSTFVVGLRQWNTAFLHFTCNKGLRQFLSYGSNFNFPLNLDKVKLCMVFHSIFTSWHQYCKSYVLEWEPFKMGSILTVRISSQPLYNWVLTAMPANCVTEVFSTTSAEHACRKVWWVVVGRLSWFSGRAQAGSSYIFFYFHHKIITAATRISKLFTNSTFLSIVTITANSRTFLCVLLC